MAHLDTIGSEGATEQGISRGKSLRGEHSVRTWVGPQEALDALYAQLQMIAALNPDYDSVEYDNDGGLVTVRASKFVDGEPVYEVYGNTYWKSIAQHPHFASLTSEQVASVVSNRELGIGPTSAGFTGLQLELAQYMWKGYEEYEESGPVLRETKVVSHRSSVRPAYAGANTVDAPPGTSIAQAIIGSLPDGEWLKKFPQVRSIGRNKFQISQEWYWAEAWPTIVGGTWTPEPATE